MYLIWMCVCVCVCGGGGRVGWVIFPPYWFFLNNSETVKAVILAFYSILLETFVPNFVFITHLSLQILGKTQTGVVLIYGFLVNPLSKEIVITPEPGMILV